MEKRITISGIILGLLFLFPSTLPAELSNYNYEIIQIAFMNGYVSALEPDLETIKLIKENKAKLKIYSNLAVSRYMKKVSDLNQATTKISEEKGDSNSYEAKLWR